MGRGARVGLPMVAFFTDFCLEGMRDGSVHSCVHLFLLDSCGLAGLSEPVVSFSE